MSVTGAQCPQEIMRMGVRWSVASPLSARPVEARMAERGVPVDHAPIQRWGITYRAQWEATCPRGTSPQRSHVGDAARSPLMGVELLQRLRKGQLAGGVGQDLPVAEPCYALAASLPH